MHENGKAMLGAFGSKLRRNTEQEHLLPGQSVLQKARAAKKVLSE